MFLTESNYVTNYFACTTQLYNCFGEVHKYSICTCLTRPSVLFWLILVSHLDPKCQGKLLPVCPSPDPICFTHSWKPTNCFSVSWRLMKPTKRHHLQKIWDKILRPITPTLSTTWLHLDILSVAGNMNQAIATVIPQNMPQQARRNHGYSELPLHASSPGGME